MKRGGWYGNPHGHALASRGIRLYAKKKNYVDPLFYARKHEDSVPLADVRDDVKEGASMGDLMRKYPGADVEELRSRGIKSVDMLSGRNTLSLLDKHGVDESVNLSRHDRGLDSDIREALVSDRKMSFLHPVKVAALKKRMGVA
jgi:hypothetical protein